MAHVAEIPILPATSLDRILTDGGSPTAVQKLRQELRKDVCPPGPAAFTSLGRYGTVQLEPAPLFSCLTTAKVWDRSRAKTLANAYRNAGLDDLVHSPRFVKVMSIASSAIQEAAVEAFGAPGNIALAAVKVLVNLAKEDKVMRGLTEEMEKIHETVDARMGEMTRFPGTVVRIEGDQALVVLNVEGREQLRRLPTALLSPVGVADNGASFVMHELTWSPERRGLVVYPAVALDATTDELRAELDAATTPVPPREETLARNVQTDDEAVLALKSE